MTRRPVTAPVTALLGALLVLVLSGCTGAGDPGDTAGGTSAAPAAPSDRDRVAAAAGALADAGTARVTAGLDGPTGPVTATGPARFAPFAADLTVDLGARGAQVRVLGEQAWLRLGGSGAWQPLAAGMLPVGAVTGALHAVPGLREVTAQPGTDDVAGVPATRYTGTVDLTAAREAAPDPAAATSLDELAGLVSPAPSVTAWLGAPDAAAPDRGRLVQLRLAPPGAEPGAPGAVTLGFAEPGLPVEISAP